MSSRQDVDDIRSSRFPLINDSPFASETKMFHTSQKEEDRKETSLETSGRVSHGYKTPLHYLLG